MNPKSNLYFERYHIIFVHLTINAETPAFQPSFHYILPLSDLIINKKMTLFEKKQCQFIFFP